MRHPNFAVASSSCKYCIMRKKQIRNSFGNILSDFFFLFRKDFRPQFQIINRIDLNRNRILFIPFWSAQNSFHLLIFTMENRAKKNLSISKHFAYYKIGSNGTFWANDLERKRERGRKIKRITHDVEYKSIEMNICMWKPAHMKSYAVLLFKRKHPLSFLATCHSHSRCHWIRIR